MDILRPHIDNIDIISIFLFCQKSCISTTNEVKIKNNAYLVHQNPKNRNSIKLRPTKLIHHKIIIM